MENPLQQIERANRYSGKKVLLVEDNELNREIATALLEEIGTSVEILGETYNYLEAENGNQAIQMIGDNLEIDLILLDINMLQMNGFEVLEIMKRSQCIAEQVAKADCECPLY